MVLKKLLVVVTILVALGCVRPVASQQCGSAGTCSTEYNEECPDDRSSALTNCLQSQTSCDGSIETPVNV